MSGMLSRGHIDTLDSMAERARHWRRIGATHRLELTSRDGAVTLMLTDYPAYEGEYGYSDRLNIYLGVQGGGRIARRSEAQAFDATLHPGRTGFAVPGTAGVGYWDSLCLLTLGADLSKVAVRSDVAPAPDDFVPGASQLHDDPLLTAVLTAMWRDAEAHGLCSAFFDHGLLIVANRILSLSPRQAASVRPLPHALLQKILDYIEATVGDDVTVAELAAMAGMSRHHFSRAFKAATGDPPYQYVTMRRIERAKHLLMEPNLTVTDVAGAIGFTNPSQFSAAFRRITGFSPSAWRQSQN